VLIEAVSFKLSTAVGCTVALHHHQLKHMHHDHDRLTSLKPISGLRLVAKRPMV